MKLSWDQRVAVVFDFGYNVSIIRIAFLQELLLRSLNCSLHCQLSDADAETGKPSAGAGVDEPSSAPSPTPAGHVPVVVEDTSDRDPKGSFYLLLMS